MAITYTRTDLFHRGLCFTKWQPAAAPSRARLSVVHEAIVNRTPTPASEVNSEIPPDLQAIIHKTLEKDRERVTRLPLSWEVRCGC